MFRLLIFNEGRVQCIAVISMLRRISLSLTAPCWHLPFSFMDEASAAENDCLIDFIVLCFVCWVAYVYREELVCVCVCVCVRLCRYDFIVS